MSVSNHAEIIANTDNYKYAIDVNEAGAKTFHSCDTKEKYIEIMKKSKHMYEILSSEIRKPYLDFDKFNKTSDQVDGLLIEIKTLYNETFNNTPITDDEMKVTYRKDAEKINIVSLHVVIDNGTYGTKEQLLVFAKHVRDSCERTTDIGVYDKNRSFKMPNMSKFGTDKISKIYNTYKGCPYDEVMKHHINIRDTTGFTQLQLKSDTPVTTTPVINNVPTPDTKNNTLTFRDTPVTYIDNDDDTIDMLTPDLELLGFTGIVKKGRYNFDCNQRRGYKCPLCNQTHTGNMWHINQNAVGTYYVKNHSDKCVRTKLKTTAVFTEKEKQLIADNAETEEYIFLKQTLEGDSGLSKIRFQSMFTVEKQLFSRDKLVILYENLRVKNNEGKMESFIFKWLKDPDMKMYDSMDFLPGGAPPNICNTWPGFHVETLHKTKENVDITKFHEVVHMLTAGDTDYFVKWLARLVQHPEEKPVTACVFKSIEGCGKNSLFILMGKIMGNNLVNLIVDADHDLFARFTDAVAHRKLIVIDEAKTYQHSRALKGLITNTETRCEKKGLQAYNVSNFAGFAFLSNDPSPVKVEEHDRRYFAYNSLPTYKGNKAYWKDFHDVWAIDADVQIAVYEYLMSIDIEDVNWENDRPKNKAYQDMRGRALDYEIKFLTHFITDGFPPANKYVGSEIYKYFQQYNYGVNYEHTNISFGRKLIDIFTKGNVLSEDKETKKAFHKTRSQTGTMWHIDRDLAFDWLKINNYTDLAELPKRLNGVFNYESTLN